MRFCVTHTFMLYLTNVGLMRNFTRKNANLAEIQHHKVRSQWAGPKRKASFRRPPWSETHCRNRRLRKQSYSPFPTAAEDGTRLLHGGPAHWDRTLWCCISARFTFFRVKFCMRPTLGKYNINIWVTQKLIFRGRFL